MGYPNDIAIAIANYLYVEFPKIVPVVNALSRVDLSEMEVLVDGSEIAKYERSVTHSY